MYTTMTELVVISIMALVAGMLLTALWWAVTALITNKKTEDHK